MTPSEARQIRLKNDYQEMLNIKGSVIDWKVTKGRPPYAESYELKVKVRTIIDSTPTYRGEHIIKIDLPSDYPRAAPQTEMITRPQPFHCNWYTGGRWCYGSWDYSESLGHHVIRMIQTLQFNLEITNPDSSANSEAGRWFNANKRRGIFPCDNTALPDPTKKISVEPPPKKKNFDISSPPISSTKKFEIKS